MRLSSSGSFLSGRTLYYSFSSSLFSIAAFYYTNMRFICQLDFPKESSDSNAGFTLPLP